jgi:predicted GNAT family acetyltransferase
VTRPDKAPQLWINKVAVARQYRRQGLGKAVLGALFDVARIHRCTVAWVLTDQTNLAAMALYASVGAPRERMRVRLTAHWDTRSLSAEAPARRRCDSAGAANETRVTNLRLTA